MEFSRQEPDEPVGHSQGVREMAREGAATVGAAGRMVAEFGSRAVDEQKRRAAGELETVSGAIRRAAEKLRHEEDRRLAELADSAAGQVDRAGSYLRERSPGEMFEDLQLLARRRPELVIGGMFVAGVALARFLKAGQVSSRPSSSTAPSAPRTTMGPSVAAGPLLSPEGRIISSGQAGPVQPAMPGERITGPDETEEV